MQEVPCLPTCTGGTSTEATGHVLQGLLGAIAVTGCCFQPPHPPLLPSLRIEQIHQAGAKSQATEQK
jgi:hypothetical protein